MSLSKIALLGATALTMTASLSTALTAQETNVSAPQHDVRTIVTTDPELDDLNSMIRFLLYTNEVEVLGLVTASSGVHWTGDGKGTKYEGTGEWSRWNKGDCPCDTWRWYPSHIQDAVAAYAEAYPNLVTHDANYPSPEYLESVIALGNVTFPGDISEESDGSNLIKDALLDGDERPIYLQVWGGPSTVARALKSIEEEFSGAADWADIQARISKKAIIVSFGKQDTSYADYISVNWPDVQLWEVATSIWGYGARNVVLPGNEIYLSADWHAANVANKGPLGELYRLWGDGKQMVADDPFDHFGYSGLSGTELREKGYAVWTAVQAPGSWISEGDTSSFMNLLGNGLRSYEAPNWGGWGGRAVPKSTDDSEFSGADARDMNAFGGLRADYAAARWFEDAQLDFAGRLAWAVTPSFEGANHRPVANIEAIDITASPGEEVKVNATATDPDGDDVTFRWWNYKEAGTYPEAVPVQYAGTQSASITVPESAQPGQTIHLILEVQDNGAPRLKHYQRVVITVAG